MSDKQEVDELESNYDDAEDYGDERGGFMIRDPLPLPSASVYSTQQLHAMIHEGHIDLNPPYQRDVVWPQEKKIALIESLFRNYYIPPVLFFVTDVKEELDSELPAQPLRICMDGKQRLTSIQAFFDGQIPYRDPLTRKKYFYTAPPSSKKLLIPNNYKDIFQSKQITCVEYRGIDATIERDIFQRVQMGVTLSAAEKLAAISSPFADWITSLDVKHIRNEHDGLTEHIKWDSRRGKHFQNLAQMILCIENLPQRTQPTTQRLSTWLRREDPPSQSLKDEIEAVLSKYWVIASSRQLRTPFGDHAKLVSPIEFVFIGVLIAVLIDRPDEVISEEIGNLRKYVRDSHRDIRANSSVIITLWDFIDIAKRRPSRIVPANVSTSAKKRRRGDNHDDDEYRPTPITNIGGMPGLRVKPGQLLHR